MTATATLPKQDRRSVFLGTADPDLGLQPDVLRQSFALQSLLFDTPVIQDTFLLSGQCLKLEYAETFLSALINQGTIAIALRSDASGIIPVARKQAERAINGTFYPFAGDSVELYSSDEFRRHAESIDRAATKGGKTLSWTPNGLGALFRDKLALSAANNEFGLDDASAISAFSAVEEIARRANRETHTCTDYYTVAESMSAAEGFAVKRWARSYYITNLPDAIGISSLVPSSLLTGRQLRNDLKLGKWLDPQADIELSEGLLNTDFLTQVPAEAILELRKEPAFEALQSAFIRKDPASIEFELKRYKRRVYERAAEFVPRFSPDAPRIAARGKMYQRASDASGVLGSGLLGAAAAIAYFFGVEAASFSTLGSIASYAVKSAATKKAKSAADEHQKLLLDAKSRLAQSRYEGHVFSLVDVVHRTEA